MFHLKPPEASTVLCSKTYVKLVDSKCRVRRMNGGQVRNRYRIIVLLVSDVINYVGHIHTLKTRQR